MKKNKMFIIKGVVFKLDYYKKRELGFRIYRCAYPYLKPTKKFEAMYLRIGFKGFWIFRNMKVLNDWPCSA